MFITREIKSFRTYLHANTANRAPADMLEIRIHIFAAGLCVHDMTSHAALLPAVAGQRHGRAVVNTDPAASAALSGI